MMSEPESLYAETCNAIRHYSFSILQIRIVIIAQGLLVLSGAAFALIHDCDTCFYAVISFGVVFTVLLEKLQENYLDDFETHLKAVKKLEKALGSKKVRGSWTLYRKRHNDLRTKGGESSWTVESGVFNLLLFSFVALGVFKFLGLLDHFFQQ